MKEKLRDLIPDNWPFWVAMVVSFIAVGWILDRTETRHRSYRYRIDYTLGRHSITDYTQSVTQTARGVEYVDTHGDTVQIENGLYLVIKQK